MPVIAPLAEERVLLPNTSWETYERLLAEHVNLAGTRFAYDSGVLEIMVVYAGHEDPNRTLASLVELTAEVTGVDFFRSGSTTFKRRDLQKGFEPDSSFYLGAGASLVRGCDQIDLAVDPPPDLVIEVDISRSSLDRFPIFAAVGVKEVWRYDGESLTMHRLNSGAYEPAAASFVLPPLTAAQAEVFVKESRLQTGPAWMRRVREWVRGHSS